MRFLYNLSVWFIDLGISLGSIFNDKAKKRKQGLKHVFDELRNEFKDGTKVDLWIHCASKGEFEQGRPIIEALKVKDPNKKVLLTFFSASGYENTKDYALADWIYYLPSDTKRNANLFLDLINPQVIVFVKYEFWANYFLAIRERSIPFYLVSAIFREDQRFFKNKFFGDLLFCPTHIFVQNQESETLLRKAGLSEVTVAGDTRFDRVVAISKEAKSLPLIEKFKGNSKLLIVGSSWKPDEKLIAAWYKEYRSDLKILVVPHEISTSRTADIKALFGPETRAFTDGDFEGIENAKVFVLDQIGMLSSTYLYADLTYIGGGFGTGIHNTLEPATFGMPIVFGPKFEKFEEAKELIRRSAAFSIKNGEELSNVLNKLLSSSENQKSAKEACLTYVSDNMGATEKILKHILSNFS